MNSPLSPEYWNERYQEAGYAYGLEPNRYLKASIRHLKNRGRVLLPGDGEGRNGVWLASHGFDVTSIDMSESGCEKTRAMAQRAGVPIAAICADLRVWQWPVGTFDAVAVIFVHVAADFRAHFLRQVRNSVVPDGVVVVEFFETGHLAYRQRNPNVGGPGDPQMLVSEQELREAFAGFLQLELKVSLVELNEGHYHRGLGSVVHGVFQRL
jgi:cyclopropane fatty-acyl-phospholipid synthase-like methyltransferase